MNSTKSATLQIIMPTLSQGIASLDFKSIDTVTTNNVNDTLKH
jgi:hypothetical protein